MYAKHTEHTDIYHAKAENFDIAIHFSGKQLRVVIPGESVLLSDVLVGPKAG